MSSNKSKVPKELKHLTAEDEISALQQKVLLKEGEYMAIISHLREELAYQIDINKKLRENLDTDRERVEMEKILLGNGQIVNTRMTQTKRPA